MTPGGVSAPTIDAWLVSAIEIASCHNLNKRILWPGVMRNLIKLTMHETSESAEPLQIDCLDSAEAFDQMQAIWQGLERQDNLCTPFNTWMWNSQWWHHCSTGRDRLALLIARQGNRVVALAPLYIHATRMCRVVPVKVLRFIGADGNTSPGYLNIIALPACRDAAERAFLDFLPHIPGWDKLHLADMLQSSSLAGKVGHLAKSRPGMVLTQHSQHFQRAALPACFEDYCMLLGQEYREQIAHQQNRLDAAGVSELLICATTEELAEATDALMSLHPLCGESQHEKKGFRSVGNEQFHRAVIRQFFAMDAFWMATLKLDGNIIGVQCIFLWRGELMFMQSGYSPEHESLSPGHVLFTYVIQRGIEQGISGLEMLKGHIFYQPADAGDQVRLVGLGYVRPGVRRLLEGVCNRATRRGAEARTAQDADTDG